MIVVADTSPINYLLLINQIDLLPRLFQQIIIPDIVRDEMLDPDAPPVLQQWIVNPPSWLTVQTVPIIDTTLSSLDPGEQAAITLAQTLPADLLIIDERLGGQIAAERGIAIIGTLGILDDAADQGLINLAEAIAQLQQTNFRVSRRIIQALLTSRWGRPPRGYR
jgi:predicted nucleic acid-binding protein